jgi:hypothetical protein
MMIAFILLRLVLSVPVAVLAGHCIHSGMGD